MTPSQKDIALLTGALVVMIVLQWYFNGWRFAL